jgi:hypothetical protein
MSDTGTSIDAPSYGAPATAQPPTAPQEEAKIGPIGRLTGVIFSPGETFEDINRKPTWLIPMLFFAILSLASMAVFTWKINPDWNAISRSAITKQMERSGQTLTAEQMDAQVRISATITQIAIYVGPVVGSAIFCLLLAGLYALGMMLIQARTTFKKVLSVVSWTFAGITAVGLVVTVASLFVMDTSTLSTLNPQRWPEIIPTNLAALTDVSSPVLRSLLSSIDVFSIWRIILLSIGLAAVAGSRKITSGRTAVIVVAVQVIGVLLGMGMAAMFPS